MLLYVVASCWDWLRKVWNRSKVKPGANGSNNSQHYCRAKNVGDCCVRLQVALIIWNKYLCAIHSTKTMIPIGPTGKSDPPQKVDKFFRNFSCWTEPIYWVLDRNFGWMDRAPYLLKFDQIPGRILDAGHVHYLSWTLIIAIVALTLRHGFHFQRKFFQWHKINSM